MQVQPDTTGQCASPSETFGGDQNQKVSNSIMDLSTYCSALSSYVHIIAE